MFIRSLRAAEIVQIEQSSRARSLVSTASLAIRVEPGRGVGLVGPQRNCSKLQS
jgi:hypothetical protein